MSTEDFMVQVGCVRIEAVANSVANAGEAIFNGGIKHGIHGVGFSF